jgi:3-oxoacyl-[acyl-carrier protein] reductase
LPTYERDHVNNEWAGDAPNDQRPSALITGASRGIGLAICQRLATAGFDLTISGRNAGVLKEVAQSLPADCQTQIVAGDMAVEADIHRLPEAHLGRFGGMDLLILCAGFGVYGTIDNYPLQRLDRQFQVNLRAPFLLVQESLDALRRSAASRPGRGARIIAIASITGIASEPGLAAYAATKAALISLCQSVNVEESASGVTATAISPGYVNTQMSAWVHDRIDPVDMIEPNDIAELVIALSLMSVRSVIPHIVLARRGDTQWRA